MIVIKHAFVSAVALLLGVALFAAPTPARADDKPEPLTPSGKVTPNGPLKAYKGPEGEIVVMVQANDSKEMLVYLKNTGGTADGKTLRYFFEDLGKGTKNVYINVKRGSKTNRSFLASARENDWEVYVPGKPTDTLNVRYSEELSAKYKVDDVLAAYKP
jgi:hypothetical protein